MDRLVGAVRQRRDHRIVEVNEVMKRISHSLVALVVALTSAVGLEAGELNTLEILAGDGTAGFADSPSPRFNKPIRLAPWGKDAVLVADIFNHAIRVVTRRGEVTTLAGGPDKKGHRDGPAEEAQFASPHGVAVSPSGLVAVAEAENHTIRLVVPDGEGGFTVSTLAGAPGEEGMRDGPAEEALFHSPHAVAWTEQGGLLVADIGNRRIRLVEDGRVRTVAGSGEGGSHDGKATEATFTYPMDIALGDDGSLFIADAGTHLIRRLSPEGRVETQPLLSQLHTPHGISVAPEGTVFIADMGAHQVVSVDREGRVERVCGTGASGTGPLELNKPAAVLVHGGLLWIADLDNHRISTLRLPEALDQREIAATYFFSAPPPLGTCPRGVAQDPAGPRARSTAGDVVGQLLDMKFLVFDDAPHHVADRDHAHDLLLGYHR
jgi:DNA-binding beta-propeller fold protein YncE